MELSFLLIRDIAQNFQSCRNITKQNLVGKIINNVVFCVYAPAFMIMIFILFRYIFTQRVIGLLDLLRSVK